MVDATTVAVNWLLLSALYALVAIGFTLIFGVGGVLNLAHGASITVGAFTAYFLTTAVGLNVWLGAVGAALGAGLFSVALYRGLVGRVQDHPVIVMILTLVVALVVEQAVLVTAGGQPVVLANLVGGRTALGGIGVETNRLVLFALSWLVIGALFAFIGGTKQGKAILATSMSHRGAALVGIDGDRVYLYTWFLAGVLAGVAGLFLASFQTATWDMGRSPLLLSFSIVVLGGLGSVRGSVVGAYLIGLLDVLTISYVSTRLSGLVPLLVLVGVLLVRPQGLFGREFLE